MQAIATKYPRPSNIPQPLTWTSREHAGVTFSRLARVRTFGGWYQHTIVYRDGVEIGRIQDRRRNRRTDTTTLAANGGAVLGSDVAWLLRQHS